MSGAATTDREIPRLLSFWFDQHGPMKWFGGGETFDNDCRTSFGDLVTKARNNSLETWQSTPDGSLALLILLDQIPRNIFRGSGESFSSDSQASKVAVDAISRGFDRQVPIQRQTFFYMPLMHGESMMSQVASLGMFQGLSARAEPGSEFEETAKMSIGFSQRHMDVIRKFGRFPARNVALRRRSTAEEEAFLKINPHGI
ncbi:MAG: hypothetical protein MMC23_003043 [Stictis urceolatum]|nr:hypothetical protein [Stictis urceolata]